MTTQFKKGIIEICVLRVISQKDMYGFEVMEFLTDKLQINENTVYPLLRRLTSQGFAETYMKESLGGAPRKYYRITDLGLENLEKNLVEWEKFIKEVNDILGGNYEG